MNPTERNAYEPSWYAATMAVAPERRSLTVDLDVDVCVVGGGLAGLTIARALARRGWSVAVLEAGRIAWNASGRNAGIVAPGFCEPIERIVARLGIEGAKALWAMSVAGVDQVRQAMADSGLQPVTPTPGKLVVQTVDDPDACRARGALLQQEFASGVDFWPTERTRAVLRSPGYFQALHFPEAFHVHPLNYALGLADAAEKAGARIFEQTRALAIDSDGVRKRVQTTGARVRATQVVLATGGDGGNLHPRLAGTVATLARPMAVTQPLGDQLASAMRFAGAVEHSPFSSARYYVAGDRLLWAGPLTAGLAAPRRLAGRLRRQILRVYPQLIDVAVAQTWSATMAYTVHRMPQIGELAPGLWLAGAFADHGINITAMAGDLIARAIVDGDDRWRLFAPYGLVWAGGRLGRAVTTVALGALGMNGRIRERLARSRPWSKDKEPEVSVVNTEAPAAAPPMPVPPTPAPPTPPPTEMPVEADVPTAAAKRMIAPGSKKKRNGGRRKVTAAPAPRTLSERPVMTTASPALPAEKPTGTNPDRPRRRRSKSVQTAPQPPSTARADGPAGTDV